MTQCISAIYENGVFRPLEKLNLLENEQVTLHVQTVAAPNVATANCDDPLADIAESTGIPDLAENFDDYRFGRKVKS